jgi:ABC-type dipeptide/oligopeptide/nickel transport system permease subunit
MTATGADVTLAGAATAARPRRRRDWRVIIGAGGVAVCLIAAIFAPLISPFPPNALHTAARFAGPSATYPLGTDQLGRDILSRLVYSLRPSLEASVAAIALAAAAGILLGLPAGYFGSWFDEVITRVLDLLIAWPSVFLGIAIVLAFGTGEWEIIIAIGLAQLPVFARLVRSIALVNAGSDHVEAARATGASHLRIMRLHVLPFAVLPLIVQFAIAAPQALMAEAALNYLGLGTQPPNPSLGAMVSEGQEYIAQAWGPVVFPVALITVLVVCLTLIADGLQDRLDPYRRRVMS